MTISEAQVFFNNELLTDAWDTASTLDKTKAINVAIRLINTLNLREGYTTDDAPQDIKDAICLIALKLLEGRDPEKDFELLAVDSFAFSGVSKKQGSVPEHISCGIPSIRAWNLIKPYLYDSNSISLERVM